jgi:hypothetical protein
MRPDSAGVFLYEIQPGDTLWLLAQQYNTTIYEIAAINPGLDLNNLRVGQFISIHPHTYVEISKSEADLKNYLRMLWEQHVVWTRLAIISIVFGLPDVNLVINRLLRNPKDFEAALRPFYGDAAAARFADLFKDHLVIAAELVKAAKAGDDKLAADAERRWYANADEIAAFLSSINPFWSEEKWKAMLHEHLALTKSEAVDMLTKNYAKGISVFDAIEKQALEMADFMTEGIIKQFPNKFRG